MLSGRIDTAVDSLQGPQGAADSLVGPPQFLFDLACPLSYLAAEQVERRLGQVEWVPVSATAMGATPDPEGRRHQAQLAARAMHVPLIWPDRYPEPVPHAMRAAAHAALTGFGARFGLAALRLAFCGGFDLDEPEILAEAAGAAGVAAEDSLAAAQDPSYDVMELALADRLRAGGVSSLPAIRVGERVFGPSQAVVAAAAALHARAPLPA